MNPMSMSTDDFGLLFGYDQRKVGCCGVEGVGRRTFNPQPDPPAVYGVMGGHGHHGHHGGGARWGGGGSWGYPYGIDPLFGMQDTPIILNQYFPSVAQGVGDAASVIVDLGKAAMTSSQSNDPNALLSAAKGAIEKGLGSGANSLPWLDPAKVGAFAVLCFGLGAERSLMPWDIGAGLLNSEGPPFGPSGSRSSAAQISPQAHNLVSECLMARRDLSGSYSQGQNTIAADGTMPDEIEAACFLFAQVFLSQANVPFPGSVNALSAAQTYDFGNSGDQVHNAIRGVMQQLIVNLPPPSRGFFSLADQNRRIASATNPNVKASKTSPVWWIVAAAAASKLLGFL